jgi:hypothetical protein
MTGDDPFASNAPSVQVFSGRDMRRLIALGVLTYAVILAATPPASLAARLAATPMAPAALGGTVWRGEGMLVGGHRVAWRLDPIRSLTSLSLTARWRIEGPDTQLEGAAALRPDGLALADVKGRADWSLIAGAAPGLAIACETNIRVDVPRASIGGDGSAEISGELRADAGSCVTTDDGAAGAITFPALLATAVPSDVGATIRLTSADDAGALLLDATLGAGGRLVVTLHPEGARVFRGRAVSGPMTLETTL